METSICVRKVIFVVVKILSYPESLKSAVVSLWDINCVHGSQLGIRGRNGANSGQL